MFKVPTVMVSPVALPGIRTLTTVLKALVPLTMEVELTGITKTSVIVLPSTLVPVTVTDSGEPVVFAVGETLSTLGTSGFVTPAVTVWTLAEPLVAAKTAVVEPAATFFWVSV